MMSKGTTINPTEYHILFLLKTPTFSEGFKYREGMLIDFLSPGFCQIKFNVAYLAVL